MEHKIGDVKYVTRSISFGDRADIVEEVTGYRLDEEDNIVPFVNGGLRLIKTVVTGLKSWTFKGVNEDGNPVIDTEKPILPINDENVRLLPGKHGVRLHRIIEDENGLSETEEKTY